MNIKKLLSLGLVSLLAVGLLAGCSSKDEGKEASSGKNDSKKITVAASAIPHADILNGFAKEKLKEKGIELDVKIFTDYPIQNKAVNEKQVDANYFQHAPYLKEFNEGNKTSLVSIGEIHAEPLAAYSNNFKSTAEIKEGSTIAIPNDLSNGTRALKLLQKQGLIELKDNNSAGLTEKDITTNTKNLKIKAVAAEQLPNVLKDVDVAIINGNYALGAKLDVKTIIFAEDASTVKEYVNIIVTREDNKDNASLKELVNVLKSDDAKKWLNDKYGAAIIPAK